MSLRQRLLAGPFAAALLLLGVVLLARAIPGYDHLRQTVSEIGAIGSPVQGLFAGLLGAVAVSTLVFASAAADVARAVRQSTVPATLIGAMAFSVAGVALFAHPHPLHNVFGISELIGYQAPLALALAWRRAPHAAGLVVWSWLLYGVIVVAIGLNLSGAVGENAVWAAVHPRQGLAQRVLFASWFGWCALVGVALRQAPWSAASRQR